MAISSSNDGFGVVNNFSPAKIEFAPAIKQYACATVLISVRPAERRTTVLGITIRAVAIIRTISQIDTRGWSASGGPCTGTNALTGTESGCFGRYDNVFSIDILSASVSPSPMIPPLQTVSFAL